MKKNFLIISAVLLLALMTACGSDTQAVSESEEKEVAAEEPVSVKEAVATDVPSVNASEAANKGMDASEISVGKTEEGADKLSEESEEDKMATP
ncbi:MAG: hypothetical protein IK123_01490, partial [Lachnospiraceae bacterium]|nr:hypothetical protein [Lachnospiraceae bacterium]